MLRALALSASLLLNASASTPPAKTQWAPSGRSNTTAHSSSSSVASQEFHLGISPLGGNFAAEKIISFDDLGRLTSRTEDWKSGAQLYSEAIAWTGRTAAVTRNWNYGNEPVETFEVDSLGNVVARTVGSASTAKGTSYNFFDASGAQLVSLGAGTTVPHVMKYGPDGRLVSESFGPDEVTQYAYNLRGLRTFTKRPAAPGAVWNSLVVYGDKRGLPTVEAFGNVLSPNDTPAPSSQQSVTAYRYDTLGYRTDDAVGCALSIGPVAGCGYVTKSAYSPRGDLLSTTNPAHETFSFGYDSLHRLTSVLPPGGGTARVPPQTFAYDGLGRSLHRTRGSASWTTTWANGIGTELNGATGTQRTAEYDARGRVDGTRARSNLGRGGPGGPEVARHTGASQWLKAVAAK